MNAINPRPVMYNIIEEEPMVDTAQKNEAPGLDNVPNSVPIVP